MQPLPAQRGRHSGCGSQMLLQAMAHAEPRQRLAALVPEHDGGGRVLVRPGRPALDEPSQQSRRARPDRAQAHLVPLAVQAHLVRRLEAHVAHPQVEDLLHPGTGVEEQGGQGVVAFSAGCSAAGDERRDHRPVVARDPGAGARQEAATHGAALPGAREHPGAHVLRLGRSAAGLRRGRPGRPRRAGDEGRFRADAGGHRNRHRLDGMRAGAVPRPDAAARSSRRGPPADAVRAAGLRHRQRVAQGRADSVFVNETLRDYCRDAGIVFTRCRPWRKNDQAFVEQKNGVVVRRIVGYRRLEGLEAAAALSRLYATTRLYVNFFQPSFKLLSKRRDGARVSKRYHPPATPSQRLLADPRTPAAVCERVAELSATLDPIRLLRQMRAHQQRLVDIADGPVAEPEDAAVAPLEQFLAGLRTAWAEGEARPTANPPAKPKRERRRPDPLVKVTERLHGWFEAEPWSTSRELLERLQEAHPGEYSDSLLRTVHHRVKVWRREKATEMVFGELPSAESVRDAE